MATKAEIEEKLDAAEARIAELDHENQALAARLAAKPAAGGSTPACCVRVVDMIVERERLGGQKHVAYRAMASKLVGK